MPVIALKALVREHGEMQAALRDVTVIAYDLLFEMNNAEPHADIPDPCWVCEILDKYGIKLEPYNYAEAKKALAALTSGKDGDDA